MENSNVIILGAGKPFRGDDPSALVQIGVNKRVLDWMIEGFKGVGKTKFIYVGGYRLDDVIEIYPSIHFAINPEWRSTGILWSLLSSRLEANAITYVSYSDIIVRPNVITCLQSADFDVALVVDNAWRERYVSRSAEDLNLAEKVVVEDGYVTAVPNYGDESNLNKEYVGLMKLSPLAVEKLKQLHQGEGDRLKNLNILDLIKYFLRENLKIKAIEIDGDWCELNAPQDVARFVLGTKAETLERLRPLLKKSFIGDQKSFSYLDWQNEPLTVLKDIADKFGANSLIVRSSALTEDSWHQSNAGNYLSVLNVSGENETELSATIKRVFGAYSDQNVDNQVLVQTMVEKVIMSGVVFTRTLNHGAQYYTINFDDTTSSTETVTDGSGKELKTVVIHKSKQTKFKQNSRINIVLEGVREIEDLVGHDSLDIEFAITADEKMHLFQVRPIAVRHDLHNISDLIIENTLCRAKEVYYSRKVAAPHILNGPNFLGVMPDWNPAEIIGTKPRSLAFSLYRHLITDEIWAQQRHEYGYRDLRPCPLILSVAGHPYVDIRASFNSFIPKKLSDDLAEKLLNYYLKSLRENPNWHDKVEFNILFTCMTFDFEEKAEILRDNNFGLDEINNLRESLIKITQDAFLRPERDLDDLKRLAENYKKTVSVHLDPLEKAYVLIEDCKRFGTLPFAHLARSAFIAVSLLKSLEAEGILKNDQIDDFMASLKTVAKMFEKDGAMVAHGRMSWQEYVEKYGHLRPGTYEITSKCYYQDPDKFLKPMIELKRTVGYQEDDYFSWDAKTCAHIENKLRDIGLNVSFKEFETFLRETIEGREYGKFLFTRNLSVALEAIAEFLGRYGINRDQMSYLSIGDILTMRKGIPAMNEKNWILRRAEEGEELYRLTQCVELPSLIFDSDDFDAFERSVNQPNYITHGRVIAEIIDFNKDKGKDLDLKGKIILIPQADPGYDWLFSQSIAGLITMYGGANSHMAIRAAEFKLPAAIGIGENLYEKFSLSKIIELNCATGQIKVIR